MIRRSWMLLGLLGFAVGVAHAGWVYGLGADGGYAYGGKDLKKEVAQGSGADMQARAYGRLGIERADGNVGLFVLGDVGKRPGNRFFRDLGVGFRLNRLELRAYDAWDFGDGANALHAGTGALSLALGRWNLGVYGYLPLGRAYAVRHINSVPALNEVAGSNQLQKGTEKTYSYDVALKGGEGRLWYTIPLGSRGDFRFGVGGYYLVRDADVLEKAEPRVGPSVDAGWDFAKTSALRVGIYGHYAYDKVLGQQLGFRLSFRLHGGPAAGEFLGLHYGVVTASFSRTAFVGQNDFNGNNTNGGGSNGGGNNGGGNNGGGNTGGGGHHDHGGGGDSGPVTVKNPKDFQKALNSGAKSIIVSGPVTLTGFQKLPDGVTLCGRSGGNCGETVLYRFGVRDKGENLGELRAPGNVLQLGANTTLKNIDVISTARDGWHNALYVDPNVEDLGTITLKNVGFHGLVFFYQSKPNAKAVYNIENLKILTKDLAGKELPFPSGVINLTNDAGVHLPDSPYYKVPAGNGGTSSPPQGERFQTGALVTVGSAGSLKVENLSMLSDDSELKFNPPLLYLYAPAGGVVESLDMGRIQLEDHNPMSNYLYPVVMVRGVVEHPIHVKKLVMPQARRIGYSGRRPKRASFSSRGGVMRAALEVWYGQVDAVRWPALVYSNGDFPPTTFSVESGTPWALLYAYGSTFGSIDVEAPVTLDIHRNDGSAPAIKETGGMVFVASHLKGNISLRSVKLACDLPTVYDLCEGTDFVQISEDKDPRPSLPMTVDPGVVISARAFEIGEPFGRTAFLKVDGDVKGVGAGTYIGQLQGVINHNGFGSGVFAWADEHTCVVVDSDPSSGLPTCK